MKYIKTMIKKAVAAIRFPYELAVLSYVKGKLTYKILLHQNQRRDEVFDSLKLPVFYHNTAICWQSRNQVILTDGMVNRDRKDSERDEVLTATFQMHYRYIKDTFCRVKKTYKFTVKGTTEQELISRTWEDLDQTYLGFNSDKNQVFRSLNLKRKSICGVPIAWSTNCPDVIKENGMVDCQKDAKEAEIEARISIGTNTYFRKYCIKTRKENHGPCILFLVPHGDDEIFMSVNEIYKHVEAGNTVYVGFYTYTDMVGEDYARERMEQSSKALNLLGVPQSHILYFGFSNAWKGKHLYLQKGDIVNESRISKRKTYGIDGTKEIHRLLFGESCDYTRDNLKKDIIGIIKELKPKELYAIDMDEHIDHTAYSLLFDECIGELLADSREALQDSNIYKGFAYGLSAYARRDFLSRNRTAPTLRPRRGLSNPSFLWEDRIAFQTEEALLEQDCSKNIAIQSFWNYQRLYRGTESFINRDSVYWERRTDSIFYRAVFRASSGDCKNLNNFKLVDYSDLVKRKWCKDWRPLGEDKSPWIEIFYSKEQELKTIRIYKARNYRRTIKIRKLKCYETDVAFKVHSGKNRPYTDVVLQEAVKGAIRIYFARGLFTGPCIAEIEGYSQELAPQNLWKDSAFGQKKHYYWI